MTISLLAIISALAIPSFQSQIASTRLSGAVNELNAALARARSESIRLGMRVTVCRTDSDAAQCVNAAGSGWEAGWIVLSDPTRLTANASVDAGENITFTGQAVSSGVVIRGNGTMANYVSFAATGQSKEMTGGFQSGRIRICSTSASLTDSERARELVMSSTGRVVIEKPAVTSDCPAPA